MMYSSIVSVVLIAIAAGIICFVESKIHDPLNIFCGSDNCYDILGVEQSAPIKDIKKAFRKLSLAHHPDKNKEENATETFRMISKAFEVLSGNESRPLFDYYLSNPRDYFKVSGQHYMQNLPKSDVRLVITIAVLLLSFLLRNIQFQKYERAVKFLKTATLGNLGPKNGGTKQTQELYKRATERYENYLKEAKQNKDKSAGKVKMQKDPIFEKFVSEVVSEVKIEGGYRKPEWNEFFAYQILISPYNLYLWALKYHRRYISKEPLPHEEMTEMAREAVGLATWEELSHSEREALIARKIWYSAEHSKWLIEQEEALAAMYKNKMTKGKSKKKAMKDDYDDCDY